MKTLITLIMIAVFTQCSNEVKIIAQISFNKNIMRNIYVNKLSSELLEHSDELGLNSSDRLNVFEIMYFQEILKKTTISFDFTDKKICYVGPGGLHFSNKQEYFYSLKKNKYKIQNTLYFINSTEKKIYDDYDVIVVYWNKKSYSIVDILKVIEKNNSQR